MKATPTQKAAFAALLQLRQKKETLQKAYKAIQRKVLNDGGWFTDPVLHTCGNEHKRVTDPCETYLLSVDDGRAYEAKLQAAYQRIGATEQEAMNNAELAIGLAEEALVIEMTDVFKVTTQGFQKLPPHEKEAYIAQCVAWVDANSQREGVPA